MSRLSQIAGFLLALSSYVQSVPFPITEPYQGRLLGSSFGVPGVNRTYGGLTALTYHCPSHLVLCRADD